LTYHSAANSVDGRRFPTRRSSDLGGVMIEPNSSTPDSNQCTKASVTGTYQPGDRAQAWIESDTLAFDATEEPKTVELRCSPFSIDRKSTRLNSSHVKTSYAVCCLK